MKPGVKYSETIQMETALLCRNVENLCCWKLVRLINFLSLYDFLFATKFIETQAFETDRLIFGNAVAGGLASWPQDRARVPAAISRIPLAARSLISSCAAKKASGTRKVLSSAKDTVLGNQSRGEKASERVHALCGNPREKRSERGNGTERLRLPFVFPSTSSVLERTILNFVIEIVSRERRTLSRWELRATVFFASEEITNRDSR